MSYSPLVERLGFDENFMDVTQMVDMRLAEASNLNELSFQGHVYNHSGELSRSFYEGFRNQDRNCEKSQEA